MPNVKKSLFCMVFLVFVFCCVSKIGNAENATPIGVAPPTEFYWQVIDHADLNVLCAFSTPTATQPGVETVRMKCGDDIAFRYSISPACAFQSGEPCYGVFIRRSENIDRNNFGASELIVRFARCDPNRVCHEQPVIEFTDPYHGQFRRTIHIRVDATEYTCKTSPCSLMLEPSPSPDIREIVYWTVDAANNANRQSRIFFRLNEISAGVSYLDWIESEILGELPYGTEIWTVFPTAHERNRIHGTVLQHYVSEGDLYSKHVLHLLCTRLIRTGTVNVADCDGWGLIQGQTANGCGLERCVHEVIDQQNRDNAKILAAGRNYRVPPLLIKNILLQESQFTDDPPYGEYGFGHTSEYGVDTLLRWSTHDYQLICNEIYKRELERCQSGYDALPSDHQAMLRGGVLRRSKSDNGITLTAAVLRACAEQVGAIIPPITGISLRNCTDYTTLWKLTVATYHTGADCTMRAISRTNRMHYGLQWENIARFYPSDCQNGPLYVERVFNPNYIDYP